MPTALLLPRQLSVFLITLYGGVRGHPYHSFLFCRHLVLQAIHNPRSVKAHSHCVHFHNALTSFFLIHRDVRLILAWSLKNDDLAPDLLSRNCAAEACLEFSPHGMGSLPEEPC